MEPPELSISILIPTYKRPSDLWRAVNSIAVGELLPDKIVMVARDDDAPTWAMIDTIRSELAAKFAVEALAVTEPGHLPPLKMGVASVTTDLTCIIDDDVEVSQGWLQAIVDTFALADNVGVVGGPALVPDFPIPKRFRGTPGKFCWYGRFWPNIMQLRDGPPLDVDSFQECNMAWRTTALKQVQIDGVLNLGDAAVYGLDLTLQAKHLGWRVVFNPAAEMVHYEATRANELDRHNIELRGIAFARNYTFVLTKHFRGFQLAVYLLWWMLIGEHRANGWLRHLVEMFTSRRLPWSLFWKVQRAKWQGAQLGVQHRMPNPNAESVSL